MIYFDHAAASTVLPEIRQNYPLWLEQFSGNSEAAHAHGHRLRTQLAEFARQLQSVILPHSREAVTVFWDQDATGLINALGMALADKHLPVWGSDLDHPAVWRMLQRNFLTVKKFPLSSCGEVVLSADAGSARLIVLTAVQSEIGVQQDLAGLIPQLRRQYPEALIMVDAVQLAAWQKYPPEAPLPDLLLISGAKLGSGRGAALLAIGGRAKFLQEKFQYLRHSEHLLGKVDIVQAAALTEAARIRSAAMQTTSTEISSINTFLRGQLTDMLLPNRQKLILTVPSEAAADNILHMILPGYQSGVLVRMFSCHNIMLSAGSACAAESPEPSRVLQALGYSKNDSYSGLRLSFGAGNTLEEAEIFLRQLDFLLKNY